jgi:PAS domain S-box-containing protein
LTKFSLDTPLTLRAYNYCMAPPDRAALDKADLLHQQRLATEAARESEARFRSVFESATDAIVLSDSEGKIVELNDRARTLFGYTAEEAVGQPLTLLMPERYRRQHERGIQRARVYSDHSVVGRTLELHGLRKDGSEFPIELAIGSWNSGRGTYYSGVIRDITDRKRLEERQRDSYERLRALSARIETVREEERGVIAREIHDFLGQALTAIRFDLAWLKNRIMSGMTPPYVLADRIDGMVEAVAGTIDRVRRISAELRPSVLDELGLVAALEGHAREFASRTGIRCRVQSYLKDESHDPNDAIALFRIVQEALTNIARYSGAKEAEIRLRGGGGDPIVVEVRDDGRGITEDETRSALSLGILGMRERAHAVGGTLEITGAPGTGTTLTVRVPARTPEAVGGDH